MFKKSAFIALIAMSVSTVAMAETLKGNVAANRSTRVYAFTVADPSTCASPGKPKMTVRKAPEHGKLTFDWGFLPAGKVFKNCANGRMRAMGIIYTPNKGYRGADSFSATYTMPNMGGYRYQGSRTQKFEVNVK
ncbi:Ig-like domain-containing protein [Rhizobium sp.]